MSKKTLNNEQTLNYLKLWREDFNEDALSLLTVSNTGLVKLIASKHSRKGLSFEELESAGYEALIRAINKFDYINRPIEGFSTYISVAIENAITREIDNYKKHEYVLSFETPIGSSKDGDDFKLEEIIGTDSDILFNDIINEMKIGVVREALKCLTSRERQIIILRYALDEQNKKTQDELAQIFNTSRQNISLLEQKALIKMRHPRNTRKLKDFND